MNPENMNPENADLLIHNVHIATMDPNVPGHYGELKDAALLIHQDKISWLGKSADLPDHSTASQIIDGQQQWLTPGLIDCHTHLVYTGDRSNEYEQRLQGVSYEEIARKGGGILSTVAATRKASLDQLIDQSRPRLEALLNEGVTTLEIKSGYGLDTESELKILKAAAQLEQEYPVHIEKTFLGAHALPPEYKTTPDAYIDQVCQQMLPKVASEKLASSVDVFCENIAFNLEQTESVFQRASELGLRTRLHAEQLSDSGGTQLAVKYNALSVDHLEYLSDEGIGALKDSGTVATLLPGAFYYLRESQLPPIDKLRTANIPIAIATDLNPGTSPLASIRLMMNLSCTLFRMTPAEALAGCTRHAAQALGLQDTTGMIREGFRADLALWPIDTPAALAAGLTGNHPVLVIQNGNPVR